MRNPLISMLCPTVIITVEEVLLTGTEASIKITRSAVVTTARTIHPGKQQQRTSVLPLCRSPLHHQMLTISKK